MNSKAAAQRVQIVNEKGLHARPSAAISRLAGRYQSKISLECDGITANARSIMDLLMLIAHRGSDIVIRAEGDDAEEAVTALASMIADGFGEDDEPRP
ncbi:MAG: HPr family phosphocarrier protein [Pseudomonadota bacterium]